MTMAKHTINPLTSKVNISSISTSTSSSILSLISSSPPDLVLLCGDAPASPLLLHSAVAQTHFPAIATVVQVIIVLLIILVIILTIFLILSVAGAEDNGWTEPVLDGGRSACSQPALRLLHLALKAPWLHLLQCSLCLQSGRAGRGETTIETNKEVLEG